MPAFRLLAKHRESQHVFLHTSMARNDCVCHQMRHKAVLYRRFMELPPRRALKVHHHQWPFAGSFTIARGSRTHVETVQVTIEEAGHAGRAECTPYPRYGESVESVIEQIESQREAVENGLDRTALQSRLSAGAARNGLDCALWDLEAKQQRRPAVELAGLRPLKPVVTAYTISLGTPEKMAADARDVAHRDLLKIKLGADGDSERMFAIREAVPDARLILDANEGWKPADLTRLMETAMAIRADLIEQPLPAGDDSGLAKVDRAVPVCADESLHTRMHLAELRNRYDCINIKLDKTGGLSEALLLHGEARKAGFQIMVGCMAASSLAMAPALLLAQDAEFVDLDGPLLLAEDFKPSLVYPGSLVNPPDPALWG